MGYFLPVKLHKEFNHAVLVYYKSSQLVIKLYTRENKDYEQIQVAFLLAMNKENTVSLIIHACQISIKTND